MQGYLQQDTKDMFKNPAANDLTTPASVSSFAGDGFIHEGWLRVLLAALYRPYCLFFFVKLAPASTLVCSQL